MFIINYLHTTNIKSLLPIVLAVVEEDVVDVVTVVAVVMVVEDEVIIVDWVVVIADDLVVVDVLVLDKVVVDCTSVCVIFDFLI